MATAEELVPEIVSPLDELMDRVYELMYKGTPRDDAIGTVVDSINGHVLRKVWNTHGYLILSMHETQHRSRTGAGVPTDGVINGKKLDITHGKPWYKDEDGESWNFIDRKVIAIGHTGTSKYLNQLTGTDVQVIIAFHRAFANTLTMKADGWTAIGAKLKAADTIGDKLSKLSTTDMDFLRDDA